MKRILLAAGVIVLVISQVRGLENADKLQKFVEAVQAIIDQPNAAKDGQTTNRLRSLRLHLGELRRSMGKDELIEIERDLDQLSDYIDAGPLRKQCEDLAEEVRDAQETRQKAMLGAIETAIQKAADVVRSAKTPVDLDDILNTLNRLNERRNEVPRQSSDLLAAVLRLDPTRRFVAQWQDYLSCMASGDTKHAISALDLLTGNPTVYLIPRSEILERIATLSQAKSGTTASVEKILTSIKTPDDLDAALVELGKLNSRLKYQEEGDEDVRSTIQTLSALNGSYSEYKAGLPANLDAIVPKVGAFQPIQPFQNLTAPVRAQLLMLLLPRYLGLPAQVQPIPGEGPHDLLNRIAAKAIESEDYLLAAQVRDTQRFLRDGIQGNNEAVQTGLFVTALNQDKAEQYVLAVISYEKALAFPGQIVPPKVIGERLATIKDKHPQEYQEGLERYLSTPPSQHPLYSTSMAPAAMPNQPLLSGSSGKFTTPAPSPALIATPPSPTPTP